MEMDYTYQREIKHNGLVSRWDEDKSRLITLSYRKGVPDRLYIIDGQHRVDAAIKNGTEYLAAEIFIDLTQEDEARMFSTQNENTRRLKPIDTYKANLIYKDPVDSIIDEVCKKHGIGIGKKSKPKTLHALTKPRDIVKIHGKECLEWILSMLDEAHWDVYNQPYTAAWLDNFCASYCGHMDNLDAAKKNLISVLRNCTPEMISVYASVEYPSYYKNGKNVRIAISNIASGKITFEDIEKVTTSHL